MTKLLAGSTTLLTYAMTTKPNPLEVSTPATLIFVVSCPRSVGSCTVSQLSIALPVGADSDATNLTSVAPSASAAAISSSDGATWTPSLGVSAGLFIFTPPDGSVQLSEQSLTIEISGIKVSPLVGTAEITIHEWAAQGSQPAPPPSGAPTGQAVIQAEKFPTGFYAFDFTAKVPQVNSGDTVTLSWVGSTNADFTISYGTQSVPVPGRTWTSPPLYATTVFVLTASATQGGQTVTLQLSTTVVVASPQVVEFYADPSEIDYQQAVTLHWRAVNADGVYLLTGQTKQQTLGPVSDPDNPVTLQPNYGDIYTMKAFKNQGGGQVVSVPVPLSFTFNPMVIQDFSGGPTIIDYRWGDSPGTVLLSWNVLHAKSVSLQGRAVPAQGSSTEHPVVDTTYDLVATWVDGSQVTATPVHVSVVDAGFAQNEDPFYVVVGLTVYAANAAAVSISDASLIFSNGDDRWQSPVWSDPSLLQIFETKWLSQRNINNIDPRVFNYPNAGVVFRYHIDGPAPYTSDIITIMWRGQFDS